jgi:hypothetical protein
MQVEGLHGLQSLLFLDVSFNDLQDVDSEELPNTLRYLKVGDWSANEHPQSCHAQRL